MPELKSLGCVRSQQAHSVVRRHRKRNRAPCLTEQVQVLEELCGTANLGYRLSLPVFHELEERAHRGRLRERKQADHDLHNL